MRLSEVKQTHDIGFKDTHGENAASNKIQALTKGMNTNLNVNVNV